MTAVIHAIEVGVGSDRTNAPSVPYRAANRIAGVSMRRGRRRGGRGCAFVDGVNNRAVYRLLVALLRGSSRLIR